MKVYTNKPYYHVLINSLRWYSVNFLGNHHCRCRRRSHRRCCLLIVRVHVEVHEHDEEYGRVEQQQHGHERRELAANAQSANCMTDADYKLDLWDVQAYICEGHAD